MKKLLETGDGMACQNPSVMDQPTDYRTSSEALAVMGAWFWLLVGTGTLIATWGVWFDLKFALLCMASSIALLLRDRWRQRNELRL